MFASLLFLTSMSAPVADLPVPSPRIENAVSIRTATRNYLEFDIAPLPPCGRPAVDSIVLRGENKALVVWHLVNSMDSACQLTTRANVIDTVPVAMSGTNGSPFIDTVVDTRSGRVLTEIGQVQNPRGVVPCPMVACVFWDSAMAFQRAQSRITSSSLVATFAPFLTPSLPQSMAWFLATGQEDYPEVAAPLAGNEGNWIDLQTRQLTMDSLVKGRITSPCVPTAGQVCPMYLVSPGVLLPIGPVQYFYQQESDPFRGDTTREVSRFERDSVLKMGPRLHLSGFVNHTCFAPLVDSALLQVSLWLVASDGSTSDSLAAAFRIPGICNLPRPGAWPYRDGKVEITQGIWVPLTELLSTTGTLPRQDRVAVPALRRGGGGADLELPLPASVRVIDAVGREILPSTDFAPGTHPLRFSAGRSLLFVQVRTGLSTTSLPLEPTR